MEMDEQFSTRDLGEAAYLVTVGISYLGIERGGGDTRQCAFIFPASAREAVGSYHRGAEVEAQKLLMVYKELKGRLIRLRQ